MRRAFRLNCCVLALLACLLAAQSVRAQTPPADFYRGKTVTLIVGYSAGGGYDTYARVLARHIGKHIPGNPAVVVQNMPGAGSLRAAQHLFSLAPKDGTALGTFGRQMGIAPLLGTSAQYDGTKFNWIGSITNEVSTCVAWHTATVKTWADMLEKTFSVGGEGSGSDPDVYAALLKNSFGVKLRLVTGYPGTAEIALALERGEMDGRASWSWSSLKALKPDWIAEKKVNLPIQLNLNKSPELPDVPLIMQFAQNDRQRASLKIILSRQTMGRPFMAPPGLPDDRKAALRAAFDATMRDAEFVAEAKARGQEVNPVSGAEIDKLLADLYATPKDIVEETRKAIGAN